MKYDFVINMIELANTVNKIMRVYLLDCPKMTNSQKFTANFIFILFQLSQVHLIKEPYICMQVRIALFNAK